MSGPYKENDFEGESTEIICKHSLAEVSKNHYDVLWFLILEIQEF